MNRQERGEWLTTQVETAIVDLEQQLNDGHTEEFLRILEFYSRFHKYSLANTMLIMMQKPDAYRVAGYRAWEKMGHHVRKGETAIWIRGPWMRKEVDKSSGEVTEKLIGYIALPVFDVSQLEGEVELPEWRHDLEGDYELLYVRSRIALGACGIPVDEQPMPNGVHGMSSGGHITISASITVAEKFLCLLHEAVHEVLHHGADRSETTTKQRELEAEAGSYLLAKLFGLENPFSRDYILSYRGTVEALHDSLTRIHLAVKQVYGLLALPEPEATGEAVAA